ncbi:hypothetical protein PRUPE_2G094900 [Prunus persica]|uniref:Uncharacterized protein n=1 Tax=Prunus persica TaxID=3760 RepID=A0A251QDH0_PRUPE|nr:hypothetical protein PRUPE_2G094900 [Prunus persica]
MQKFGHHMSRYASCCITCIVLVSFNVCAFSNAKTEVSLARLKRKSEKEVSSPFRELSTIGDCMEILEAMEGVNDDAHVKAFDKFTNLDWRKMFLKMLDPQDHREECGSIAY